MASRLTDKPFFATAHCKAWLWRSRSTGGTERDTDKPTTPKDP